MKTAFRNLTAADNSRARWARPVPTIADHLSAEILTGVERRRGPNRENFYDPVFPTVGPDVGCTSVSYGDFEALNEADFGVLTGAPLPSNRNDRDGNPVPRSGRAWTAEDVARVVFSSDLLTFSDYSGSSCERSNVAVFREKYAAAGFLVECGGSHGTEALLIPAAVLLRTRCGACGVIPTIAEALADAREAKSLSADELAERRATVEAARRRADAGEGRCERCALANDLRKDLAALDDYPVADDDAMGELEREAEDEAWGNYGASDFEKAVRARFPGPCDGVEIEFVAPDDLDWFELFREASDAANVYPEHETGGGVYFDTDRAAAAVSWTRLAELGCTFPKPRPVKRARVRAALARYNRARHAQAAFGRRLGARSPKGGRPARKGPNLRPGVKGDARPTWTGGRELWAEESRLARRRRAAERGLTAIEEAAQRDFTSPRVLGRHGHPAPTTAEGGAS